MDRLIEKLEDETDRAQHAAKSLHTNLKKNALQREQNSSFVYLKCNE